MKVHKLIDSVEYKVITADGRLGVVNHRTQGGKLECKLDGEWYESTRSYNEVVGWEFVEPEFSPEYGEMYYYPAFYSEDGYDNGRWSALEYDRCIKRTVGTYRTREQAQQKARELGWLEMEEDNE